MVYYYNAGARRTLLDTPHHRSSCTRLHLVHVTPEKCFQPLGRLIVLLRPGRPLVSLWPVRQRRLLESFCYLVHALLRRIFDDWVALGLFSLGIRHFDVLEVVKVELDLVKVVALPLRCDGLVECRFFLLELLLHALHRRPHVFRVGVFTIGREALHEVVAVHHLLAVFGDLLHDSILQTLIYGLLKVSPLCFELLALFLVFLLAIFVLGSIITLLQLLHGLDIVLHFPEHFLHALEVIEDLV
mmetsp:Transcript_4118/g.7904  ORF Transcript_4118/g.7904 Transcript_4118/m.7904 type:complete len:243 (-) Transcript_4118:1378-2106(-)